MDTNNNNRGESLSNSVPFKDSMQTNNQIENKIVQSNDHLNKEILKNLTPPKNTPKKDLYYNRKIENGKPNLKGGKSKNAEGKTIALSDEEWENAGNPLGFEKLGTVKSKKRINVFSNLKEKELEEQIALLGTLDLNELSACDDSFNPIKKPAGPINKKTVCKNNSQINIKDINTNDLPSFIGLLAKSFVEDYSKNKSGKISMVVFLNNE
uniref:Uncharacterized protein n=1 Tax=Strongyloides papillosus TaxID=174720 RepID=A0A0N5B622_STREA